MNKVITDGLVLMPPAFTAGLGVWSSENGTPGSTTWASAGGAAIVPADQDFGGCLELVKSQAVTRLRYMGETPVLPGCYLRITARVKAMSGPLPSVRIAGWAGGAGGVNVAGVPQTGPAVPLPGYGQVVTVQAIVGTGTRIGVDMPWGRSAMYGHFGLDLTGPDGGVVRIDDIEIEDVTGVFHRKMMDWIDVRDFGALGDGVTDDSAAFAAADAAAAAAGVDLLVSAGIFRLAADVTLAARVRFEGRVTMPADRRLALTRSFDFATYADAFGSEELAFRKAFQALLNFTDHVSLDLGGRRVQVGAPIDMQAAVPDRTTFATRRVIRNGQIEAVDGPDWAPTVVTAQATYTPAQPLVLSAVANPAAVPVGALVTGAGVGREVYVTARNVAAGTLTLSQPLHDAEGTQVFTFTRFKYLLDFSGFADLSRLVLADLDIQCNGLASGILLPPAGEVFELRGCAIHKPRDRGITSHGRGCQGLTIEGCQILSNEMSLRAQDRTTVALNVNANDAKLRSNRIVRFRHFAVMAGSGHLLVGNHWFQGDDEPQGLRLGGLVLTQPNVKTTLTGNYIDNCFVEWTNEHSASPAFDNQFSFGGLTLTGNILTCSAVAPWFAWLVLKPYGAGHFVNGLSVCDNVFRAVDGSVDRIERLDTSFAPLDFARMRNIRFEGNTFSNVTQVTASPVVVTHVQATAATVWTVQPGAFLPFGGWARRVESVLPEGMITGAAGERRTELPFVAVEQGPTKQNVTLNFAQPAKGRMHLRVRVDVPQ
ncbi:MAG: glycoside hydrolase family 55 protein [Rhodobacteraceae bacterium]|nr:glycoside hydrolase family 55 protein [Paracoccaceae bacterium]